MLRGNAPRRSRLQQLILTAGLGIALVGITQCRGVSDRISGLGLRTPTSLSMRSGCARRCNDQLRAAMMAEQARYMAALRACGNDQACVSAERRAHGQRLAALLLVNRNCKHACYNEGAGRGGE